MATISAPLALRSGCCQTNSDIYKWIQSLAWLESGVWDLGEVVFVVHLKVGSGRFDLYVCQLTLTWATGPVRLVTDPRMVGDGSF